MIYTDSAASRSLACVLPCPQVEDMAGSGAAAARRAGTATPLDRAYDEFCRLAARGETPDLEAFLARYPAIQSSLARILDVHGHVQENPHFFDEPPVHWPQPGEDFLGFHLERQLGRGAFSHVFLATEPALGGRRVVVKISRLGAAEALTLGRLEHPNIGPVYSVTLDNPPGLAAVCMPFLGGATLGDLLVRVRSDSGMPRRATAILDVARMAGACVQPSQSDAASAPTVFLAHASYVDGVRHLARQMLDALAFIHGEGVIHRDLKPSNVLLSCDGTPLLLDFNLSCDVHRSDARFGGTPVYMAPEQLQAMGTAQGDAAALDGRSDLFSLGVILYELLTGEHPFAPPAPGTPFQQIRRELLWRQQAGPRPLRELNAEVDRGLANLVAHCLAFRPDGRPQSAAHARALLEHANVPARRTARRRVCMAMLLMSALAAGSLWFAGVPRNEVPLSDLQRGLDAYGQANHEQAVAHLNAHLIAHKDDAQGWFARGLALLKLGEHDPSQFAFAIVDFKESDRLYPDAQTKACLGYALQRNGKDEAACHYYELARAAGYASAEVLNNLGCAYQKKTATRQDADRRLTEALDLNPNLQAAHHNRGRLYYRQALAPPQPLAPDKAVPFVTTFSALDLLEKALQDLGQAMKLGPLSGDLCHDAALVCAELAKTDTNQRSATVGFLDDAVRHGLNPRVLSREPFETVLAGNPKFKLLQQQPHVPHPHAKAQFVLAVTPR